MQILGQLKDDISNRKAVLFLGAGASQAAGLLGLMTPVIIWILPFKKILIMALSSTLWVTCVITFIRVQLMMILQRLWNIMIWRKIISPGAGP